MQAKRECCVTNGTQETLLEGGEDVRARLCKMRIFSRPRRAGPPTLRSQHEERDSSLRRHGESGSSPTWLENRTAFGDHSAAGAV